MRLRKTPDHQRGRFNVGAFLGILRDIPRRVFGQIPQQRSESQEIDPQTNQPIAQDTIKLSHIIARYFNSKALDEDLELMSAVNANLLKLMQLHTQWKKIKTEAQVSEIYACFRGLEKFCTPGLIDDWKGFILEVSQVFFEKWQYAILQAMIKNRGLNFDQLVNTIHNSLLQELKLQEG